MVKEGLEGLNPCRHYISMAVGFLTNLLRAYIAARRHNIHNLYRFLSEAWLEMPKRLKHSCSGYELFRISTKTRYYYKVCRQLNEQPSKRFWQDMTGNHDKTIPPPIQPFLSYVWYPVLLLLSDGLLRTNFKPSEIDERERLYHMEVLKNT